VGLHVCLFALVCVCMCVCAREFVRVYALVDVCWLTACSLIALP
jgi:hypothetical protein